MDRLSDGKRAMAKRVVIEFRVPHEDHVFWHRVGNWQDELWDALRLDRRTFPDWNPSRTWGPFSIAVVHGRDLKAVQRLLLGSLAAHSLADEAVFTPP